MTPGKKRNVSWDNKQESHKKSRHDKPGNDVGPDGLPLRKYDPSKPKYWHLVCNYCKQYGHIGKECTTRQADSASGKYKPGKGRIQNIGEEEDEFAFDARPQNHRQKQGTRMITKQNKLDLSYLTCFSSSFRVCSLKVMVVDQPPAKSNQNFIQVYLGNIKVDVLIDTGYDICVITAALARDAGAIIKKTENKV